MQKKHSENSFSFDTEDTIYHWQFSNWSHMEWSIIIRWYIETTQCHTRNGGRSSNMIQMVGTFCLPIHHTRSCPWSRLTILPARHSILRWNLCKRWWKMKEPGSYPHLPRPTLRGIMENTNAISKMVVLVYQNYASLKELVSYRHSTLASKYLCTTRWSCSLDSIFYVPYWHQFHH